MGIAFKIMIFDKEYTIRFCQEEIYVNGVYCGRALNMGDLWPLVGNYILNDNMITP